MYILEHVLAHATDDEWDGSRDPSILETILTWLGFSPFDEYDEDDDFGPEVVPPII